MPNLCKLGDVFLTLVEDEDYDYSNDITERAMEDGSKVTDHAKSNLITIKISGIITGKGAYPQEQLTKLRLYCLNRNVLQYVGIQSFSSVMIESFGNKHSKEVANGITFDINLKEIRVVKKTSISVNTGKLNIPDIEALKDQLEKQKETKRDSKTQAKTKLKTQTNAGKKGKQPKQKKSVLQKIKEKY